MTTSGRAVSGNLGILSRRVEWIDLEGPPSFAGRFLPPFLFETAPFLEVRGEMEELCPDICTNWEEPRLCYRLSSLRENLPLQQPLSLSPSTRCTEDQNTFPLKETESKKKEKKCPRKEADSAYEKHQTRAASNSGRSVSHTAFDEP